MAGWNRWDQTVESSRLEGAFVEGAPGSLKPKGGPATRFVLTHVEPQAAFTNRSRLPLGSLEFVHTLRLEGDETVITHRVDMEGPLTFLFRIVIGENIARTLPAVVERLARAAERSAA